MSMLGADSGHSLPAFSAQPSTQSGNSLGCLSVLQQEEGAALDKTAEARRVLPAPNPQPPSLPRLKCLLKEIMAPERGVKTLPGVTPEDGGPEREVS